MNRPGVERERAVWRDFRRAQGHSMARRARENPPVDSGIIFLAFLVLILILLTDPVVWWGLSPDWLYPVPPLPLFFASLLLLPLNGWITHVLLARWTPRDGQRPMWVRALRFAVASLFPFGGFAIVPLWREVLRKNPSWIRPREGLSVPLALHGASDGLPKRLALERLHESELLKLSLLVGSALPFVIGALIAVHPEGVFGRRGALAFNLALHAVAFFGMSRTVRQFSYLSAGSPWIRLLPLSRWLFLFPSPLCAAGPLILILAAFGPLRGTLVGGLYSLRSDALRFPLWRKAGRELRPEIRGLSWADLTGRPPQTGMLPEEGRGAEKRAALLRLALLFLPLEAGVLTWSFLNAGGWQPGEPALMALLIIACSLAFGSLLLQAVPAFAEKLRWDRARRLSPYLRSGALLLPVAGCLLGILGGVGAARGDIRLVGSILELLAGFLAVFGAAYALRGLVTKRFDLGRFAGWGLLYASLATLGIFLEADPGVAHRAMILILVAPVLRLAAGFALAPALLRPYKWRDIFCRRLPSSLQRALFFMALTAILPLGGLAAPFWIWARQNLWRQPSPAMKK